MGKRTKSRAFRQGLSLGGGRFVRFLGFRDRSAHFFLERYGDQLHSVSILSVPLRREPQTRSQCSRARRWAQRWLVAALEAA